MKILLAGATGAVGKRLVPLLVRSGHQVVATTRTANKIEALRAAGAEPVVLDALDRTAVMAAVAAARPEVVVHQLTALTGTLDLKHFDRDFAETNRLRTEGTEYLLAASAAAGVRRFIIQSYTGWNNIREGGRIKTEEDPLDPHPTPAQRQTLAATRQQEAMIMGVAGIEGIALRYGSLYGPGTSIGPGGEVVEAVRARKMPIVGNGAGVWSFLHIDDAAEATRVAIERGPVGIYNIVDDDPAEVSVWLPEMARIIGAPAPYHVPAWIARLLIGETGVSMMTKVRGSSNAKARRLLSWQPAYASWRDGFQKSMRAVS
jgi:nucleoside-diphosphate-sugar epimerase